MNESRTCRAAMLAELPCVATLSKSKAEAWTAKSRCPKGSQVEKFRSFEHRALEDPEKQNKQPQPLATWHAQRKHRTFLIEFPLDLERVEPFPAGSYGENPWKVFLLRPERHSSHFE